MRRGAPIRRSLACGGPIWGCRNVIELEVVTGRGRHPHLLRAEHEPDLFAAVLGGPGQCAVITAKLRLIPAPPRVRRWQVSDSNIGTLLRDRQMLATRRRRALTTPRRGAERPFVASHVLGVLAELVVGMAEAVHSVRLPERVAERLV